MEKFTSIEQFRNVVRRVREVHDFKGKTADGKIISRHDSEYPILQFTGTVKLHGTNSAIVKYVDGSIKFQSRERELSLTDDNAGFMSAFFGRYLSELFDGIQFDDYCAIYGEWCGGSIQKKVALNKIEKMFVIFAVKVDGEYIDFSGYKKSIPKMQIFNINQFPKFTMDIDFEHPETTQNKLTEITEQVEALCPVGKYFGVDGIGEGVVWNCFWNNEMLIFKVKGEKHQSSKVKQLATLDLEKVNGANQFVEYALTESRLFQGIEYLKEMNLPVTEKSTGDYLRWIMKDIIKEESETMEAAGLIMKDCQPLIARDARRFLFNNIQV
jgi:hypothetical protein